MIIFRVLSDENDYFVREYEVPGRMTLLDLHRFICCDLAFGDDVMASFRLADKNWTPLTEYTLLEMGEGGATMESLRLEQLTKGQRLVYMFDLLSERALYMELVAADDAQADTVPCVVRSEGDAPSLDGPESGGGSIFDEAMGEFGSFEGDDGYEDE